MSLFGWSKKYAIILLAFYLLYELIWDTCIIFLQLIWYAIYSPVNIEHAIVCIYNDRDRVGPTETVGCLAYSYN